MTTNSGDANNVDTSTFAAATASAATLHDLTNTERAILYQRARGANSLQIAQSLPTDTSPLDILDSYPRIGEALVSEFADLLSDPLAARVWMVATWREHYNACEKDADRKAALEQIGRILHVYEETPTVIGQPTVEEQIPWLHRLTTTTLDTIADDPNEPQPGIPAEEE